jgi:hypothetical protein
LTTEQRMFYDTNGYLLISGALPPEQLVRVQAAAENAEKVWRHDPKRPGIRGPNLYQVLAPIEYDDELLELLWHPVIFPMVRSILGSDVSMIDNDYFITVPHANTHAHWHRDYGLQGVFHPLSTLMVKVFYFLTDVNEENGPTMVISGSHKYPDGYPFPEVEDPKSMPGAVAITGKAGDAYFFHGRIYHAAANNESDRHRRVLIYNYGHTWMKIWQGYEPSKTLQAKADTRLKRQLLGMTDPYGPGLSEND